MEKVRKPRNYWTKETCHEEALKYKNRNSFKKGYANAYNASVRNKWIDDICVHMIAKHKSNNYWTKEKCHEEALKYKTKTDFMKKSATAYVTSGVFGWKDEICSHMVIIGNRHIRCVYAVEFSDNSAYIGLTYDIKKRFDDHINDVEWNTSSVLKHIKETGIIPVVKQLSNFISLNEVSKLEGIKKEEYENNGWIILNKAKCGNTGGNTVKWTKVNCLKEALKYKSRNEFKHGNENAYTASIRNKWLDEISIHMIGKYNPRGFWTKEKCLIESLKYKVRDHFKKNSASAFNAAYKNGWLDEFFPKK